MDFQAFCDRLLKKAKEMGFEKAEASLYRDESFQANVTDGEVDDLKSSASLSLAFRGIWKGKMGQATTEVLDAEAEDFLLCAARDAAELIENEDPQFLYEPQPDDRYAQVESYFPENEAIGSGEKIALGKALEKACLEADPRVKRMEYNRVCTEVEEVLLRNSEGLNLAFSTNPAYLIAVPILDAGEGKMVSGEGFQISGRFSGLCPEKVARDAVEEAVGKIGATSIPSGVYPAVLKNSVMATLLETFDSVFSADEAQKGLSLLKDREGQNVAAACVTLLDDPLLPGGFATRPFDGEGVPTYTKPVIEDGVLKTLLYNLRTAYKAGRRTTGNGHRSGAVCPSNLYIAKGTPGGWRELAAEMGSGVVITDMMGMHAGANTISGDFSLSARGYLVENGVCVRPVEQITVAGNFFSLLKTIERVGDDLFFGLPGVSCAGSPSVRIGSLAVAGSK